MRVGNPLTITVAQCLQLSRRQHHFQLGILECGQTLPDRLLVIRGGGAANAAPVTNKQPAYADNGIVKLIAKTAPKLGLQALALGIFALSFCDEATKTEICSGLWGAWIVARTLLKISSMAKSLRSAVQRLPIVG